MASQLVAFSGGKVATPAPTSVGALAPAGASQYSHSAAVSLTPEAPSPKGELAGSKPANPDFGSASEDPTSARAGGREEVDSAEKESLRVALELQREEEWYMAAQREGAARLAELEATREDDDDEGVEEEEEEEEEEIDESLALAWRLQQEEDDRALFIALNGGQEPPPGMLPRNVSPSQMTFDELTQLGENIGKVSKGTSKSAIDDLPTCTFRVASSDPNVIVGDQCAICRLEYQADDILRILPCRHAEHAECAPKDRLARTHVDYVAQVSNSGL